MTTIEALFLKSKGQPVVYNGRTIQMVDRIIVTDGQNIKVVFQSVNSAWRQGICLTTKGGFVVNNQIVKKCVVLWHDTAPQEVLLQIQTKSNECQVKNVWDTGDGIMHSWHSGGAMIVENVDSGKLYRCNDGGADDNFDDLIFRVELLSRIDRR